MIVITFGSGSNDPHSGGYVEFWGCTEEEARLIMNALYGRQWSSVYQGDEALRYLRKYQPHRVRTVATDGGPL